MDTTKYPILQTTSYIVNVFDKPVFFVRNRKSGLEAEKVRADLPNDEFYTNSSHLFRREPYWLHKVNHYKVKSFIIFKVKLSTKGKGGQKCPKICPHGL